MAGIIEKQEDSFELLEANVKKVLADPLMEKVDWQAVDRCWGKAYIVSFINRALVLHDERKEILINYLVEYAGQRGYEIMVRV